MEKFKELIDSKSNWIVWRREAIFDFFEVVENKDIIICDNIEYFQMAMDAYRHFIWSDRNPELVDWREFFDDKHMFKQVCYDSTKRFKKIKKKNPFDHFRDRPKRNKWITTSLIERDYWNSDIRGLEERGFQYPDGELFKEILSKHPDFIDLGDSRSFSNSDELISKLQIVRDSRMYIGSCCSWSNWASENGVPTYITFNALTGAEHHEDTKVKDILPNLRKGYVRLIGK